MRPDSLVDKTYIAKVEGIVTIPSLQKLRNGVKNMIKKNKQQ